MMAPVSTRPGLGTAVAVTRWSRPATVTTVTATLALVVLAALPYLAGHRDHPGAWSPCSCW